MEETTFAPVILAGMPDPVARDTSLAAIPCGRDAAIQARALCAITSVAADQPDLVAYFDIWRSVDISIGKGIQRGPVFVRLEEAVRIMRVKRTDRFYQDSVGVIEQNAETATLVPAIGLKPDDILVRQRDGVAFDVKDSIVTSGVESLKIQQRQMLFTEPSPGRGTIRMAFVGAQVGSDAILYNLLTESGDTLTTEAGDALAYA